jgi:hypothetical protein
VWHAARPRSGRKTIERRAKKKKKERRIEM